jgi:hypothetical protein
MAKEIRDMIEALSLDEYGGYIDSLDFSRQEIEEMCAALMLQTSRLEWINNQAIKYLRLLRPKRVWGMR